MLITINYYMLICIYSVNSLRKDVIGFISIENDNTSKTSDELSDEKKYLKVEIKNSNANEIILSSCSSESLENYKPMEGSLSGLNRADLQESNNIYHGKILNSKEETRRLWAENDKTSQEKILIESRKDNKFHGKARFKSQSDNLNKNRIMLPMKKQNNIYPEKILTSYIKPKQVHEEPKAKNTDPNEILMHMKNINIYPEKIEGFFTENQKYMPNTNPEILTSYVETDKLEDVEETKYNNTNTDKENVGLENYAEKFTVFSRRKQSEEIQKATKLPVFYSKTKTEQEELQNKNVDQTGFSECSEEKEKQQNTQIDNKDPNKVSELSREMVKRAQEWPQSENVEDYEDTTAAASRNSTIEVSDRGDQDSMVAEETDDEDKNTLVDYPYTVSVQRKGAHYASGALVGERWVLSTAAEFYNVRETIKLFRARLGSVDCKKGGIVIPIKSIVIHPNFVPGRPCFDVAVLRMAEPVPLSSVVKPIGLSRVVKKVMSGKFLTTYWPRIVVKEAVLPPSAKERIKYNSMRVSTQKLVPQELCIAQIATVNITLDKSSLCLKPVEVHHSVCMPDVGAPVVAVDGLWGITSGWISPLCPSIPLPTVFTRVSAPSLRTWIEYQMVL